MLHETDPRRVLLNVEGSSNLDQSGEARKLTAIHGDAITRHRDPLGQQPAGGIEEGLIARKELEERKAPDRITVDDANVDTVIREQFRAIGARKT